VRDEAGRRHRAPTVGLATCSDLPDLDPDDRLLLGALEAAGASAVPAVWSDPEVSWARSDVVVIRSTWDYHRRVDEFLRWVDTVAGSTRLLNDARTVRWNSHKTYLRDLEADGVPIVPTVWLTEGSSVQKVLRQSGWKRAVLKPEVGASGEGTRLLDAEDEAANEVGLAALQKLGEVMLQPYLAAVDDPGERSLVFVDGVYSHAVLRAPKLSRGFLLREGEPVTPSAAERKVAEQALSVLDAAPVYARVDLVPNDRGLPCLMELELIEPLLYLATRPGSAERLSQAILQRLR
jgi:glutathione synthase/RimK-type ligase-like ATP-grasp enzyme